MKKTNYCVGSILFLALAATAVAQQASFDELLARVAAYQVGDDERYIDEMDRMVATASGSPEKARQMEQGFLRALGGATLTGKERICRHLMMVGSAASIPVLAGMLGAADTADMARYALERIPGPAVNPALREMLPKSSGTVKAGILNTLGRRRDSDAIPAIRALLQDNDLPVALAAAAALGLIAGADSASALAAAHPKASGALHLEIDEAWLRCADGMMESRDRKGALAVFQSLAGPAESEPVRVSALRGLGIAGETEAVPLLAAALRTGTPNMRAQAIRSLSAVPGNEGIAALRKAFPGLDSLAKVQALSAAADRGDKAGLPILLGAVKDPDQSVRAMALLSLGALGDASSVMLLAETAAKDAGAPDQSASGDLAASRTGGFPNERRMAPAGALGDAAAARDSLARLRGPDVDRTILAAISAASDPRVKAELIAATSERGMAGVAPTLLPFTADANREVRRAALRALRTTAAPGDVPALLDLLAKCSAAERPDVVRVLSSTLRRSESASVGPILSAYQSASDTALRASMLSVLAQVGKEESLPVLRSALKDSDPEIQRGAIRALSDWPTAAPVAELLEIARSNPNSAVKTLSLQGAIRLIGLPDSRPPAETVKLLSAAMGLASRPEEKRAVLSLVQTFAIPAALELAEAAANDPEVADEAKMAAARIRRRLTPPRQ